MNGNLICRFCSIPYRVYNIFYQYLRYGRRAKKFDRTNFIGKPLELVGIENISLGKKSFIRQHGYIIVSPLTGELTSELVLGDNSYLNYGCHVVATKSIRIGDNVNIAPYVYLSDNTHSYEDINIPIKLSPIKQLKTVSIGDGTWIGTRAAVFGCTIGKHCVIGANSVVNKDIPDYCIVGGIPAKILKRFDQEQGLWRKTDPKGNFID